MTLMLVYRKEVIMFVVFNTGENPEFKAKYRVYGGSSGWWEGQR